MTLDILKALPAKKRSKALKIGEIYRARRARNQATTHLRELAKHPELVGAGLPATTVTQLRSYRNALPTGLSARDAAGAEKRVSSKGYTTAISDGKDARLAGQVLARSALRQIGEIVYGPDDADKMASDETLATSIEAMLEKHSRAGADPETLKLQVTKTREILEEARVADFVSADALKEALKDLKASETALDNATRSGRGTPAETEDILVLAGLIVELCREVRSFAAVAARRTGSPALLKTFQLSDLNAPASTANSTTEVDSNDTPVATTASNGTHGESAPHDTTATGKTA